MKNSTQWKPTKWIWNESKKRFVPNLAQIYAGSVHIAWLQIPFFEPLFRAHTTGLLLDCGCGAVPYYDLYRDLVHDNTCIDWEQSKNANPYLDHVHDLNELLPFSSSTFDTILMTDVLSHIRQPNKLFAELNRVLKPGGKLILTNVFINWIAEPPYEYGHHCEYGYRQFCAENHLDIIFLEPYGGNADVLLDTLNKTMTSKFTNRIFRVMRKMIMLTPWYKKNTLTTRKRYPIGYALVAQKPVEKDS